MKWFRQKLIVYLDIGLALNPVHFFTTNSKFASVYIVSVSVYFIMNSPIQVDASDFILQSLNTIGTKLPAKAMYILLIKSYQCGYCVKYMPTFEQVATKYSDVGFLLLEASTNGQMIQQWRELDSPAFEVQGYPTVVMYGSGGNPDHVVADRNQLDVEIARMRL